MRICTILLYTSHDRWIYLSGSHYVRMWMDEMCIFVYFSICCPPSLSLSLHDFSLPLSKIRTRCTGNHFLRLSTSIFIFNIVYIFDVIHRCWPSIEHCWPKYWRAGILIKCNSLKVKLKVQDKKEMAINRKKRMNRKTRLAVIE